jgi:hypothetical protein
MKLCSSATLQLGSSVYIRARTSFECAAYVGAPGSAVLGMDCAKLCSSANDARRGATSAVISTSVAEPFRRAVALMT